METRHDPLAAGREAFAQHQWQRAYTCLNEADAQQSLDPEDLERLADAARWSGHYDELLERLEQAQTAYTRRGDRIGSARTALALARYMYEHNNGGAATGWWMRAARDLEGTAESVELGHLHWMLAHACLMNGDFDGARQAARQVVEVGRRLKAPDLEALGLHDEAHVLLAQGQVRDGLALVDEAMTVAMSGSCAVSTTGTVYCGTIWAYRNVGDWRRASEWTDASLRWCERESVTRFPGLCRFHRAEVMRLRGALADAEQDALAAAEELVRTAPVNAGWAFGELGEIRRRRGDAAGAADAFRRAVQVGYDPQPGFALLRLDADDPAGALRMIERALADPSFLTVEQRPALLPSAVRIAVAAGDIDTARARQGELEEAAEATGSLLHLAGARESAGRIELAEGNTARAASILRDAIRLLCELEAPYETAHVRLALAEAYTALDDSYAAALESDAARATFERLGANADLARLATRAPARRQLTFLFTDIVDSTRLVEVLGNEAWLSVLDWHDRTVRATLHQHQGTEVEHTGDGFFATFPDADRALDFAVELQRTLLAHRHDHGFAPQVRVGVHAGEALSREENLSGRDVHVTARIAAAAGGGEILVSEATIGETTGRATSDPRSLSLKGVADLVDVVTLDWR